jgi:hypothetical protein
MSLVEMREHLGVASTLEEVTALPKFVPELAVVVELAVLHRPDRPTLVRERLMPPLHINDAQPADAEGHAVLEVDAAIVRAAVGHDVSHHREYLRRDDRARRSFDLNYTADPAHVTRVEDPVAEQGKSAGKQNRIENDAGLSIPRPRIRRH